MDSTVTGTSDMEILLDTPLAEQVSLRSLVRKAKGFFIYLLLFCYYQAVNAINTHWRQANPKFRHLKSKIFTASHRTPPDHNTSKVLQLS